MYDAIVVGARVAGSPTAMLLARRGHRVLLVDRVRFPSETMSTHFLQIEGVRRLRDWGLLDRLVAAGTPPISTLTMDFGPARVPVSQVVDGLAAYCPRRSVLDTILAGEAVAAGAELREEFSVQEVIFEDGRVAGIRGRSKGGDTVEERARVVIGADGRNSLVARSVAAETYHERPTLGCGYYGYWSGLSQEGGAELYLRDGNALFFFPTNDGLNCIAVEWRNERFHEVRSDIPRHFMAALDAGAPAFAERVRAGTQEERFVGSGDLPNFFRRSHGPGWALVGDAGYHKDPVTGSGITDAFRDADFLAEALDDAFSGRKDLDDALAGRAQRRDAAALPSYEATCRIAEFAPPGPELFKLFGPPPQAQAAAG